MIASGRITQKGSRFPEDMFHDELYHPFMDELKRRGVIITHRIE
jgi:hypothetical protein